MRNQPSVESVTSVQVGADTIFLLSLDVSSAFASELGLEPFFSIALRNFARNEVRETFLDSEVYPDLDGMLRQFGVVVSEHLGDHVLSAIRSWQGLAFPEHRISTRLWIWTILLESLRQAWDDQGLTKNLPLTRPDLAWARMGVRDYVCTLSNIRAEVRATGLALDSHWDREVERRCEDWFAGEALVISILQLGPSREFWSGFQQRVEPAELEALQSWARSEAKREKMPLGYVSVPRV